MGGSIIMENNPNPVYYPQPEPPKEKNGAAVVSLIMGILGLVMSCCGFGRIFGIVALICGIVSKSKSSTGKMPGMAIAGLIMGIVSIIGGLIGMVAVLIPLIASGGDVEDILSDLTRNLM